MILDINGKYLQFDVGMMKIMKTNTNAEDPLQSLSGLLAFAQVECIYLAGRQRYNQKNNISASIDEIKAEMDDLEMSSLTPILSKFTDTVRAGDTADAPKTDDGEKKE